MPKGVYQRKSLSERLEELTERNEETGCLYFKGHLDKDGYGQISVKVGDKHTNKHVHRVVWEEKNGPIPSDMKVMHLCDDKYPSDCKKYRKCCEITHLKLGTNQENLDRMKALGRSVVSSGAYKKGHGAGETNVRAILNWEKVREIRSRKEAGLRYGELKEMAEEYGISYITIQKIISNSIWKEKPEEEPAKMTN